MKFTDGYWQMRDGMVPHYAEQVHEVEVNSNAITVYAPTKKLNGRGDTLNLPLLTIRYSSPMENVIQVKAIHHKGTQLQKPEFEIYKQSNPNIKISNDDSSGTRLCRYTRWKIYP
jgi:alpha-D-xyloside xylohydrolase